jgi:hypothetical protein
MKNLSFFEVAWNLEDAGLVWAPEIGDEVSPRQNPETTSVLFDPQGMTPAELRSVYVWLPTFEQMVTQVEVRQAILFHFGLELTETQMGYRTVIKAKNCAIEKIALSPRCAMGLSLLDLLLNQSSSIH